MRRVGTRRSENSSRPLWTCPECGQHYVTRNMWHSCGPHTVDQHFVGKPPHLRPLFNEYVRLAREHGKLIISPKKTYIALQARVRFAKVIVRKNHIVCSVAFRRQVCHPRLWCALEVQGWWEYRFRVQTPSDLDADVDAWLRESYSVGAQRRPTRTARLVARRGH